MRMRLALAAVVSITLVGITQAAEPADTTTKDLSAYILTPAAPATPRINGARVYGERPGMPFLFTVPATGDRPMKFAADGLPDGLQIDPQTGRITGSVAAAGTYIVKLTATNAQGSNERTLKIIIGDEIALTPQMGWNSWNCWAKDVDQEKVLASAHAMVDKGLINHGWTYINTDDTWQGRRGGELNAIQTNAKFPDIKSMCDQIHAMGLKAGIYSTPWVTSYALDVGGSSNDPAGKWDPSMASNKFHYDGKYLFADRDAKQWGLWGFDYLKYDWNPRSTKTSSEDFHKQTENMQKALAASGRDILYSYSNAMPFDQIQEQSKMLNSWRTTGDIRDSWSSLTHIGFSQNKWAPYARPGHWNDPDMLVVGLVGWSKNLHPSNLTPDEQYTHISLWCLLSAPLLIGCPIERMDDFTLSLLTNDEVLALDQDSLGKSATLVSEQGDKVSITNNRPNHPTEKLALSSGQVWAKDLEDGTKAAGLFNLSDQPMTVTANFADLKLTGQQTVRDLWRQKDLGQATDKYETQVPAHGVVLLKFSPAK
ncbi:MAG TPA: putative Ig domain-containing protein [Tepidisphaeraceae bacterium]|jgi:alpha-galactosidase|nr:putative Ig domain-containing protein [Tepidisphaeraceae bacterium]